MEMFLNHEQYTALQGLSYWISDSAYITERFGQDDPELQKVDATIRMCFDECDKLQIPFWVQNATISFGNNWRYAKEHYLDSYLKSRNIFRK